MTICSIQAGLILWYMKKGYKGQDMPILAIELDGKEHRGKCTGKGKG